MDLLTLLSVCSLGFDPNEAMFEPCVKTYPRQ